MIEPIAAKEQCKQQFSVADIENWPDGRLLMIGYSYRWADTIQHEQYATWSTWFDRILELAFKDRRFRTIYAHNGGGWDWLSLLEYLMKDERYRYWKIEGVRVQSKLVVLRVHVERKEGEEKRTRFCLRFADSLYLLRSSLAKLATKFGVTRKVQLESTSEGGKELPHQTYLRDRQLFDEYLRCDCEALLLTLESALSLLRSRVAKIDGLGLTIGSTALKIFRTGYLNRCVEIPYMKTVRDFLREGYRGGRVEVFKYGVFDHVSVYDINSLYPTAMVSCKVPVSDKGDWTGIIRWKLPGCYEVDFEQRNTSIPPVLLLKGTGGYRGRGTYFTPELRLLTDVDPSARISVVRGYCFHESDFLFGEYVRALYQIRLEDKDGPLSLLCKYLLNSLYGKFAQRSEREQYLVFSDIKEAANAIAEGRKLVELDLALGTWAETTETKVAFEHVGIAGMITSQARSMLYRGLLAAGAEKVVYCDTDSVHTTGKLPNALIGNELGQFKLEFSGSGVYAGRKIGRAHV